MKTSNFDLSSREASKILKKNIIAELSKNNDSKYIQIVNVQVKLFPKRMVVNEVIDFKLFADIDQKETIYCDCIVESLELPKDLKLSKFIRDLDLSLTFFHVVSLLNLIKQCRKAFRMLKENNKEILIPILMKVAG